MFSRRLIVASLLVLVASSVNAQADESCSDALVIATYSRVDTLNTDYRLAWHVSESAYEEVKKKAGVNAVIYGVPVGANYSDFQKNIRERTANYASSFTQSQATNVKMDWARSKRGKRLHGMHKSQAVFSTRTSFGSQDSDQE